MVSRGGFVRVTQVSEDDTILSSRQVYLPDISLMISDPDVTPEQRLQRLRDLRRAARDAIEAEDREDLARAFPGEIESEAEMQARIVSIRDALSYLDVSDTARLVLLLLATYADSDGDAWPTVATLAARLKGGERTVRRALAELEAAGVVKSTPRPHRASVRRIMATNNPN